MNITIYYKHMLTKFKENDQIHKNCCLYHLKNKKYTYIYGYQTTYTPK